MNPGDLPEGPLSAKDVQKLIGCDNKTRERLEEYVALLLRWQKKINLIGPATIPDIWRRHVLDSAQLLPLIPSTAKVFCDLGSGAGFPGLVLAILGAETMHLIESDRRKAVFLAEVNRQVRAGAIIHAERIERVVPIKADVVLSRALAPLPKLLEMSAFHLQSTGLCMFLKGQQAQDELTESCKNWRMTVHQTPSLTDPNGIILQLQDIEHLHG